MVYNKKTFEGVLRALSEVHGFDYEEAHGVMMRACSSSLSSSSSSSSSGLSAGGAKSVRPEVVLPWCGKAVEGWCSGLRLNHGLLSQCTNKADGLCKTCGKHADGDGRPTYGLVSDRVAWDLEHPSSPFRNHKGKACKSYGLVMEKLGVTREAAEREAKKFDLTIPDTEFEVRKTQKGRPRKSPSVSDSEDDKPKRGRGRPRKMAKEVHGATGDDLIAQLLASATEVGISSPKVAVEEVKVEEVKEEKVETPTVVVEEVKEEEVNEEKAKTPKAKTPKAKTPKAKSPKAKTPKAKSPTMKELKEQCKAAGLKVTGNKSELMARLADAGEVKKELTPVEESEPVAQISETKMEDNEEEEEEEEEETLEVSNWTCPADNKNYLKSADGEVFDLESQEQVGIWNEKTQTIDEVEDDDDY